MSSIGDRLLKNFKKRKGWLKQSNITAYRLYDWDIPEYPFFVDVYNDNFLIHDRTGVRDGELREVKCHEIQTAILETFKPSPDRVLWKNRTRQKGSEQYEKLANQKNTHVVTENTRRYLVNLSDYLDTGLFLDHRPLRQKFNKTNSGRFLNLFSYTCSVGVAAALGGATTTNVDLSKTYLDWGRENYRLNNLDISSHKFLHEDVLSWLKNCRERFDTIFLDPPTFSNSKRMEKSSFDVLRDQNDLIKSCLTVLADRGQLFFSNNHSDFRLNSELSLLQPKNLTKATIPQDFHNPKVHHCFLFSKNIMNR